MAEGQGVVVQIVSIVKPKSFKKPALSHNLDKSFYLWQKSYSQLIVDLGCGVGYHPIWLARNNPNTGVVAIERTKAKFLSMQRRSNNHELHNLFCVHADAQHWIPQNLRDKSLDHLYFLYPNPYPKRKQANKRYHRQAFFEVLLNKLKDSGQLTFATNEKWLHEECETYLSHLWKLNPIKSETLSPRQTGHFRTHFEKKYLSRGESCFNLVFAKQ